MLVGTGNDEGKIWESYFFEGPYGSGKTHLLYSQYRAVALGEEFLENLDLYTVFRTTHELLDEFQQHELGKKEMRLLQALSGENASWLHLFWDDADKFKVTDFKLEMLFHLIDMIYKHNANLSITSNLNLIELQEKLSPAICRRIDDICEKVKL